MKLGEAIDHTPPLKRIDLKPAPRLIPPPSSPGLEHLAEVARQIEAERIWALVVESARHSSP